MDSDINPTLLLGIVGGIVLFGATTMIHGTIWATSIDMATPVHDIDSTGGRITPNSGGRRPGDGEALFLAGDIAHRAIGARGYTPGSAPAACAGPALGPGDELLDMICEHDL